MRKEREKVVKTRGRKKNGAQRQNVLSQSVQHGALSLTPLTIRYRLLALRKEEETKGHGVEVILVSVVRLHVLFAPFP